MDIEKQVEEILSNKKYKTWNGKSLTPGYCRRMVIQAQIEGADFDTIFTRKTLPPCDYSKNPCYGEWCRCSQ